jgi:hypothetical protein
VEIPESARQTGDVSWLQGCWNSRSNLYNLRTGEPVQYEYCFDGNGQGRFAIQVQDAQGNDVDNCVGTARARIVDGRLVIQEDGRPVCEEGGTYYSSTITCTPGDERTECSIQQEGSTGDANSDFSRKN